ncbi:HtaA domain-containing protein [Corynebacterium riegelii]|uniref:HtaA domain-containing protein n=1 Tax=Corynebacterium riegelii TaxID=156976 RepID=UPI0023F4FEBE|nr:HtaA domain-containing protein [Corynebacterium riegelii]MDK7180730.1 HtaA domain-containing protein [Corynebacterium riegelii]
MSRTSTLALVTAATVASTALFAPAASAAETPELLTGNATWNIKESFLRYVQSPFTAGTITVTDGAEKVEADGKVVDFKFPVNVADSALNEKGEGTIDLDGAFQIVGHKGAMDIQMSDFKIVINGNKGHLQADYVRKGAMPGSEPSTSTGDDKPIIEFDVKESLVPAAGGKKEITFTPTAMTESGVDIFGTSYTAGKPLEDSKVGISLDFKKAETPADPKPDSSASPAAIGGIVVAVLAVLGGLAFATTLPQVQAMLGQFLPR